MERLLGHLAQLGSFTKQGELLCTQGLAYLLRDADGESRREEERVVSSQGHLWIGLDVPLEVRGDAIVDTLVAEAEAVLRVLR